MFLHRLLTQVVIDAVNLALFEHRLDLFVQGAGGIEVTAERLFDSHAALHFGDVRQIEVVLVVFGVSQGRGLGVNRLF
jgi:hypothetical protein